MRLVLTCLAIASISGCSTLQSNVSHLELSDFLTAPEHKRATHNRRVASTSEEVGDWSVSSRLQPAANVETEWSPIELYGDKAGTWVWTSAAGSPLLLRPQVLPHRRAPLKASAAASSRLVSQPTPQSTVAANTAAEPLSSGDESPAIPVLQPLREPNVTDSRPLVSPLPPHLNIPEGIPPLALAMPAASAPTAGIQSGSPSHDAAPASLAIGSASFCRAVRNRGDYDALAVAQFPVGARTLVYCEVSESADSAATRIGSPRSVRLAGRLAVKNAADETVYEQKFAAGTSATSIAESPAFVVLPWTVPELPSGTYRMSISIEDESSQRVGSVAEPLGFVVTTPTPAANPRR